jgi:Protein of unknown function (DUF4232)
MNTTRLLLGVVLGAVALGGCSSSDTSKTSGGPSASTSASVSRGSTPTTPSGAGSPTTSASTQPSPVGSSSSGGAPARCATPGLQVSLSAGEGAAGSTFYALRLRNTTRRPCRTGGFGGVSFVHSATGAPIGAPADRVRRGAAKPLTLRPGARAEATLQQVNAENYPARRCHPVAAQGLRVYPPNETRSLYIAHRATACRSAAVHLLSLAPYHTVG